MPAARFEARGRVQGVGFRYWVRNHALHLGIRGWIRNEADGSVAGCVSGELESLTRFQELLREGPRSARVDSLDWTWLLEEVPSQDFEIRS